MKYVERITIPKKEAEYIESLLKTQPSEEYMLKETLTYFCRFKNGFTADAKICPILTWEPGNDNRPLCEVVLFNPQGYEVNCSEAEENIFGVWAFQYEGDQYIVTVSREF